MKTFVRVTVQVSTPAEAFTTSAPVYQVVETQLPPGVIAQRLREACEAVVQQLKAEAPNGAP